MYFSTCSPRNPVGVIVVPDTIWDNRIPVSFLPPTRMILQIVLKKEDIKYHPKRVRYYDFPGDDLSENKGRKRLGRKY